MNGTISQPIKRNAAADIIRCLAFYSVVSVHFFLRSGFYGNTVTGEKMMLMVFMRSFFIICVPLYMILSGYLMKNKTLTIGYYKKIGKTYLTYVLAALCCITYSAMFLKQAWSLKRIVLAIFEFTAAPYAWYVEMYLGIFLIIPFLNILYNNIPTQNWKKVLLLVMVILTSFPAVLNVYNFNSLEWWLQPSSSRIYSQIIPAWWTTLYPVTYYFIGCYLSEFGLKIKKSINLIFIALTWVASSIYTYWRSYKSTFIWGDWCDYESIFNVILASLIFVFFINLNYDNFSPKLSALFKKVSALCFGSYLVSWIFDKILYTILIEKVPEMTDRLGYYFIIAPLVFVCSLILSFIISKIQILLENLWSFTKNIFIKAKA